MGWLRTFSYVCRLRSFRTLRDFEFDLISFLQAFVSFGRYRTVVNENIIATVTSYETVTFGIVEPFDSTFQTFHKRPLGHASFRSESCLSLGRIVRLVQMTVKRSYYQKPCISAWLMILRP